MEREFGSIMNHEQKVEDAVLSKFYKGWTFSLSSAYLHPGCWNTAYVYFPDRIQCGSADGCEHGSTYS